MISYRIKEVKTKGEDVKFYPQYNKRFLWRNIGDDSEFNESNFNVVDYTKYHRIYYWSLGDAETAINNYKLFLTNKIEYVHIHYYK
jgi:hypothetical protein